MKTGETASSKFLHKQLDGTQLTFAFDFPGRGA
jgi:hypothetical protein